MPCIVVAVNCLLLIALLSAVVTVRCVLRLGALARSESCQCCGYVVLETIPIYKYSIRPRTVSISLYDS